MSSAVDNHSINDTNCNDRYRQRYSALVLLSLCIHLTVLVWFYYNPLLSETQSDKQVKTVSVSLLNKKSPPTNDATRKDKETEKPKKKEQKKAEKKHQKTEKTSPQTFEASASHAPAHTREEFSSSNQHDKSKTKLIDGAVLEPNDSKTKLKAHKKATEKHETSIRKTTKKPDDSSKEFAQKSDKQIKSSSAKSNKSIKTTNQKARQHQSDQPAASQTVVESLSYGIDTLKSEDAQLAEIDKILGNFDSKRDNSELTFDIEEDLREQIGNINLLNDAQLGEVEIEDPFSEKESKEIGLVNRYLQRMTQQVMNVWVNPYKGKRVHKGVIIMELNAQGILLDSYIYQTSGLDYLDQSVLDALRSIPRYHVPDNEVIANRYYKNLRFFYSSIKEQTELMPFEIEEE